MKEKRDYMSETIRKPSEEKAWLKFLPEASLTTPIPEQTIYEFLSKKCQDYPDNKAIYYYGTSIT